MIWRRAHDLGFAGYVGLTPIIILFISTVVAARFGVDVNNTWQGMLSAVPVVIGFVGLFLGASQQGRHRFGAEQRGGNIGSKK
jgi:uncharacterized membrane protein YhaH (DUF805 family)